MAIRLSFARLGPPAWRRRVLLYLLRIVHATEKMAASPAGTARLGLHLKAIHGRRLPMAELSPLTVDLGAVDHLEYAVDPRDAAGVPTSPTLAWASSDPAVLTVAPAADGRSAMVSLQGPGTATLSVTDGILTDSQADTLIPAAPGPTAALNLTVTVVPK